MLKQTFFVLGLLCLVWQSHAQNEFITTWQIDSDGDDITIPTTGAGYDYTIDWGDGVIQVNQTGDATHAYATAGTYTVKISGDFPRIYFNGSGDKTAILTIEQWGEIEWTSMEVAFSGCSNLTYNATDAPDLSNVTTMRAMFQGTPSFDAIDLTAWNVSTITDMSYLFSGATVFNGDISNWDVSKVTDMTAMLRYTDAFNQDVSNWNTSSLGNAVEMFAFARSFNQDVSNWDISGLSSTLNMFDGASSFNQNLGDWDMSNVTIAIGMLDSTALSIENYDSTWIGWSVQTLQSFAPFSADGLAYCYGATARKQIEDTYNWFLFGDEADCSDGAFITTWNVATDGDTITIPTNSTYTYNYLISWGDGEVDFDVTGDATHTYATAGTYTVEILGDFPSVRIDLGDNEDQILSIEQWGSIQWSSMDRAFSNCSNLTYNATDAPDLSNVTSISEMFQGASSFNASDLTSWDVSTVNDMNSLFRSATVFNGDVSTWDVRNVTDMSGIFSGATAFNQDVSGWDIRNLTSTAEMFEGASSFNQNLGSWDMSNVSFSVAMLDNTALSVENYDSTLIGWATQTLQGFNLFTASGLNYCAGADARQQIIDTYNWFGFGDSPDCTDIAFITTWQIDNDGDEITIPTNGSGYDYIIDWGDGSVETGQTGDAMHTYATAGTYTVKISGDFPHIYFNNGGDGDAVQTIEQWGEIEWASMEGAFSGCSNLTYKATDAPDLSNVTSMENMFQGATAFDATDLTSWNVSTITDMGAMFKSATVFNGDISNWDVSNVTDLSLMFNDAVAFNQDISTWNTSKMVSANEIFKNATSFNQDVSNWDISGLTSTLEMFDGASSFNQNLGDWDMSNVTFAIGMLDNTALSIENYDSTLIGWASQTLQSPNFYSASGLSFCYGATARKQIEDTYGWIMFGDGADCSGDGAFITTWEVATDGETITVPTRPELTYEYLISWGDGEVDFDVTGDATHTYTTDGKYTIQIVGVFPSIYFNDSGDKNKIEIVEAWGPQVWENLDSAFYGCSNLTINASDTIDLSSITSLVATFRDAASLDNDLSSWDWEQITSVAYLFSGASSFNQDVSTWNVSNVTNMTAMFEEAGDFDQNLSTWNVEKVIDFTNMLNNCDMSTENYDNLLIGWSAQSLSVGATFGATGLTYCTGEAERQKIIDDFGWTFSGDGSAGCLLTTWDGSTWDNGEPSVGMTAAIGGDYDTYVHGTLETEDLTVKPNYSLTVRGDSSATIDGDLINLGSIFVKDSSSLIQRPETPTNSGDGLYSVEREGTNSRGIYNYWSSPVMNTTIDEVFGATGRKFYTFDADNQNWEWASTTDVIETGLGFIATGTSTTTTTIVRTFSDNTGFNSGEVMKSLYYSGSFDANDNWHLVGNPYPSGLDVISFLTDNASSIENAVYLWSSDGSDYTSSSSDYAVMNLAGSISAGGSGIAPTSATISSAQGFFVQSKASSIVYFRNAQRVSTNNTFQRVNTTMQRIWLGVEKENGVKNEILLAFLEGAETEKDQYDANKLSGNGFVSLYSVGAFKSGNRPLAIQGLPALTESTVVSIGIEAKEAGEFTFRLNHLDHFDSETEIYLADKETGSLVNIRTETYSVNLAKGDYQDRFELRFVPAQVTSLEEEEAVALGVRLFTTEGEVKVQFLKSEFAEATVGVYDISGRLIGSYQNEADLEVGLSVPQTGIYIVKVANRYGTVSKKLFVE